MPTCRVIIDPPQSGAWNMAVDEALLAEASEANTITLRLYQWSEPTLSLGYFQRLADRQQHQASRQCAAVRRQSGGGAILHDRELTYSLVVPAGQRLARDAQRLYQGVHDVLIGELVQLAASHGVDISLARFGQNPTSHDVNEPFLCFERRAAGDVVLRPKGSQIDYKIVGSAQRRRRGAVLQHGSILLETSPAAPELPGLKGLTSISLSAKKLADDLPAAISAVLDSRIERVDLATSAQRLASTLVSEKYDTAAWRARR